MPTAHSYPGTNSLPRTLREEYNKLRAAMLTLSRLVTNALLATGTVAIGTTKSKVRTTAIATYLVDGALKTKAATDDLWTLSGDDVIAERYNIYLLYLDAAGAASIAAGTAAAALADVVVPEPEASKSIIGHLVVQTAAATTFEPGTTLLDAAGITATYVNGPPAAYMSALQEQPDEDISVV